MSDGRRIAGERELATGPRFPEHLIRRDSATVGQRHGLSSLERPAFGAVRNAERLGPADVEPSGARGLDQRPAERRDAVRHGKRCEAVAVPLENVTRLELDELNLVRQLPDDALERAHQVGQSPRPVKYEGKLAAP